MSGEERPVPGCDESWQLRGAAGREQEQELGPEQRNEVQGFGLGQEEDRLWAGQGISSRSVAEDTTVDLTFGQLFARLQSQLLLPSPCDSSSCLTRSTSCFHQLFDYFSRLLHFKLNFLDYLHDSIVRFAKLVQNGSNFCTLGPKHERLGLIRQLFGQLILAILWQRSASTLLYYPHCKLLFAQEEVVQLCCILGSFRTQLEICQKRTLDRGQNQVSGLRL